MSSVSVPALSTAALHSTAVGGECVCARQPSHPLCFWLFAGLPHPPGSRTSCHVTSRQDAGIRTADAVILRPPINEMDRWCNNKATSTARIREADALVMAGIIQVGVGVGLACTLEREARGGFPWPS